MLTLFCKTIFKELVDDDDQILSKPVKRFTCYYMIWGAFSIFKDESLLFIRYIRALVDYNLKLFTKSHLRVVYLATFPLIRITVIDVLLNIFKVLLNLNFIDILPDCVFELLGILS